MDIILTDGDAHQVEHAGNSRRIDLFDHSERIVNTYQHGRGSGCRFQNDLYTVDLGNPCKLRHCVYAVSPSLLEALIHQRVAWKNEAMRAFPLARCVDRIDVVVKRPLSGGGILGGKIHRVGAVFGANVDYL